MIMKKKTGSLGTRLVMVIKLSCCSMCSCVSKMALEHFMCLKVTQGPHVKNGNKPFLYKVRLTARPIEGCGFNLIF